MPEKKVLTHNDVSRNDCIIPFFAISKIYNIAIIRNTEPSVYLSKLLLSETCSHIFCRSS